MKSSHSYGFKHYFTLLIYATAIVFNPALGEKPPESSTEVLPNPEDYNALSYANNLNMMSQFCATSNNFIDPANKHRNAQLIEMGQTGAPVGIGPKLSVAEMNERSILLKEMRGKAHDQFKKEAENIGQNLLKAKLSMQINKIDITPEIDAQMNKIYNELIIKCHLLTEAKFTQSENRYGNCAEHAYLSAGLYLQRELLQGDVGKIQIFTVEIGSQNHVFVVLNSGVDAQSIKNDPEAVAKLFEKIDKQPRAYLCDEYNHESGKFNEIRDTNAFYGKDSVVWRDLKIQDIPKEVNINSLPPEAKDFIETAKKTNDDLNNQIMNMLKPQKGHAPK